MIASAKLTLRSAITGGRGDGYHLIDAEMVSLDLPRRADDRRRCTTSACPSSDRLFGDRCSSRRVQPRRSSAAPRRSPRPRHDRQAHPARWRLGWGLVRRRGGAAMGRHHGSGRGGLDRRGCRVLPRRRPCPCSRDRRHRRSAPVRRTHRHPVCHPHRQYSSGVRAWDNLGGPTMLGPNDLERRPSPSCPNWPTGATGSRNCAGSGRSWPGAAPRGSSTGNTAKPSPH